MIITKNDDYKVVVEALRNEEICLLPTETVYGVCVRYDSIKAFNKLVELKNRPSEKSFPIAVGSIQMIEEICELTDYQRHCINKLLPGPITVILKAKNLDSYLVKNKTIAVRYSDDKYLEKVINELGHPILLTSANLSGEKTFTNVKEAEETFKEKVKVYVDGEVVCGLASTIIDLTDKDIKVLREGKITLEEIKERIK